MEEKKFEEIYYGLSEEGKDVLNSFFEENDNATGIQMLNVFLALNDHDFELMRPVMQDAMIEAYNEPQNQIYLVQTLAQAGVSVDDILNHIDELVQELFNVDGNELSDSKKDFFKFIFSAISNAIATSTINPAHIVEIPVEICRENVKLPTYATDGSGAMDIYSPEEITLKPGECKTIPIGIKVSIPHGYAFLIQPRSGLSCRIKLRIPNSPGLIDSDYHEEIGVIVENIEPPLKEYLVEEQNGEKIDGSLYGSSITIGKGERFAQMRLTQVPRVKWQQVTSLGYFDEKNDHGKGFGSTGAK